jgi:hypothetical protein
VGTGSEPFEDSNWLFEFKYDGFRALCFQTPRVPMTRAMSLGPGRAILIHEPRRSYIAEHAAVGIRPGAGGGDPAAARRANPPGAGARADASVAGRDLDGSFKFPRMRNRPMIRPNQCF